jgi:5-methylcytosine-specific restriction enzyme subunit McrC
VKIPIKNLYYLLCFAWEYIPEELALDVTEIPASSDVLTLCAHVLIAGIDHLVRRGLDQGYLLREEQTARLRGRINIAKTFMSRARATAEAVCQFDDLSPNLLHNQILRSTVGTLMRAPSTNRDLEESLRTTFKNMNGIEVIRVSDSDFQSIHLHRNNSYYAFLLFVCKLVHSLKLPDQSNDGRERFRDLLSDERAMQKVFEAFLRNFYKLKQDKFKRVGARHLHWNAEPAFGANLDLLPQMRTDVTLHSDARTIIMDAKCYRDALQERYETSKVHSGNLYQLLAYLSAEWFAGGPVRPEGILIYPVGDSAVDASFMIDGYQVRIYTLNLGQDWQDIEQDLLRLIN